MDMTAMVDVAFLLLTFFMLTAVFSQPLSMEINLPESENPVEIAESNVFQLRVDAEGTIWYQTGKEALKSASFQEINTILRQNGNRNPGKTVTVLKIDRDGKYANAVDLLDEFDITNIERFAISPMTDADKALIAAAKGGGAAAPTTGG